MTNRVNSGLQDISGYSYDSAYPGYAEESNAEYKEGYNAGYTDDIYTEYDNSNPHRTGFPYDKQEFAVYPLLTNSAYESSTTGYSPGKLGHIIFHLYDKLIIFQYRYFLSFFPVL